MRSPAQHAASANGVPVPHDAFSDQNGTRTVLVMESLARARLDAYFQAVLSRLGPAADLTALLITHLLAERPAFVRAVAAQTRLVAVLPKPKSIDPAARCEVERIARCDPLSRAVLACSGSALDYLEARAAGARVALLDVGGYFAPALADLHRQFSGTIVGVVEDTENGHRRYADLDSLPCPVISVARSPLKDPEDHLVGQSIAFSIEALVRADGATLHGRTALVIGYGKIGSSVAACLRARQMAVRVYDLDPVRRAQALAHGLVVDRDRDRALAAAEVVLCATGNTALHGVDFARLRTGAYVATVTSADDELDLAGMPGCYRRSVVGEHLARYAATGHYFYLANRGNAVNFVHGAGVGPYIHLVQAEILAGVRLLAGGTLRPGIHEVGAADRAAIANTWLDYFSR
jgi:adenosylhomocysteinase